MFTGYMILDEHSNPLYSESSTIDGIARFSDTELVRDRDYPGMRIAFFAQSIRSPTVYEVIEEDK